MIEGKSEENKEQTELADIKKMLKGIEDRLERSETRMKRERVLQLSFPMMIFMVSTLLVFLSVTLTSGEGKQVYSERWFSWIFTFFAAGGIGFVGFWFWMLIKVNRETDDNTRGNETTSTQR